MTNKTDRTAEENWTDKAYNIVESYTTCLDEKDEIKLEMDILALCHEYAQSRLDNIAGEVEGRKLTK